MLMNTCYAMSTLAARLPYQLAYTHKLLICITNIGHSRVEHNTTRVV